MDTASGAVLFARYAYPPNQLGYCGPGDPDVLLEHGSAGSGDDAIAARARQFDGAWVYLELIAQAAGIDDPLDPRVVRAYWIGGELLDQVDPSVLLDRLRIVFRDQVGGYWNRIDRTDRALAHHSFQVLAVYPWVPLLASAGTTALSVLDQCRIRWGRIERIDGEQATVRSQPLVWDSRRLSLGEERDETARWSDGGRSLSAPLTPGDRVALHWDWICDRLAPDEVAALIRASAGQLELANDELRRGRVG